MLRRHIRRCFVYAGFGLLTLTGVAVFQFQSTVEAAEKSSSAAAADQTSFHSGTARMERDPGTPVGPPKQIILCHNGHTIRVSEKAAAAHFAHGDTSGPCPGQYVICHKYPNFDSDHTHTPYRTIIVSQADLAQYLAQGDTQGPCPNQAFMCNRGKKTIVVSSSNISDHLSRGQQLGLCPGKLLICHKGHTMVIKESEWPQHQAEGDCQGYCYGSAGPLVDQTTPCSSSPPTSFGKP
jgi:hypothetical protein